MKTIKERMDEYIDSICSNCRECRHQCAATALRKSFIAGAGSEHAELTRWNDPTISLPKGYKEVLLKMKRKDGTNHYVVGWLTEKGRFTTSVPFLLSEIEGWRYIHE